MNPLIFLLLASLIDLGKAKATEVNEYYVKCRSELQSQNLVRFDLKQDSKGFWIVSRAMFISPGQRVEIQEIKVTSVIGSRDKDSILPFSFFKMLVGQKTMMLATNDGQSYFLTYGDELSPERFSCDIGASRPGVVISN